MLTRAESPLPDALEEVVYRVIGCALSVHKEIGPGYVEPVYHKAMVVELAHQGLAVQTEHRVEIKYRGQVVHVHRIDLLVEGQVIVELKAVARLEPVHQSQVVSYLAATGLRVGLLINFNTPVLKGSIRRIVR